MDTQTERYNKQIQALQVTLDTEREKLMWTDQKLKEMSSKLSLSERNHLNSAKQTQDMQVCATRMCPPYVRNNVFFSLVLNVSTALIIVILRWTYLDVTSWCYVNGMWILCCVYLHCCCGIWCTHAAEMYKSQKDPTLLCNYDLHYIISQLMFSDCSNGRNTCCSYVLCFIMLSYYHRQ